MWVFYLIWEFNSPISNMLAFEPAGVMSFLIFYPSSFRILIYGRNSSGTTG